MTPELASQWAASAQYHFLDALMADPQIQYEQIAFHGGTSLHFSWRSPRLSEDLDFLVARNAADLSAIVERAGQKVAETFRAEDPQFAIEIQDRTRQEERMISYGLRVAHAAYLGKALIKVEFWRVSSEYLAQYPVELRSPIQPGEMVSRISNPVPAATLETAYCDKLTAFATRPYLKWRDIYDLWWIGTQTDARLDLSSVTRQFLHNVSAYRTIDGLSPAQALRKFLENNPAEVLKKADPDLRRWLPNALWDKMHPQVTAEMVEYVRGALQSVADAIEMDLADGTLKRVRQ
ncbi:MAG TPA: nucleotidyl transferase AbiEii/AbiGii toxin family protein [Steroidobacteraceae bacterium]|nr:nucleotidyl transferase AbiEii/AbiGii toxin family protein [Steroidobacteraceae bacterium]